MLDSVDVSRIEGYIQLRFKVFERSLFFVYYVYKF